MLVTSLGFKGFNTRGHTLPNTTLLKILVNSFEVVVLHISVLASSDVPPVKLLVIILLWVGFDRFCLWYRLG